MCWHRQTDRGTEINAHTHTHTHATSEIPYLIGNKFNTSNTGPATGPSPASVPSNSTWPISHRTNLIHAPMSLVTFYLATVWVFHFRFCTDCYFAGIWTVCPIHRTHSFISLQYQYHVTSLKVIITSYQPPRSQTTWHKITDDTHLHYFLISYFDLLTSQECKAVPVPAMKVYWWK